MATPQDFTTRARDEVYSMFIQYQALQRRIQDLTDEVDALGGAAGLYGATGASWPAQADGVTLAQMGAAFAAITALIGTPTTAQRQAAIRARR